MTPWQALVSAVPVRFGPGRLAELGELARQVLGRGDGEPGRVLLVTDPGVVRAGHAERARQALEGEGFEVETFERVSPNPTTGDVEAGTETARFFRPDLLVGLGGGSAMDCAKGINFLLTQGGRMEGYRGKGKARRPMLPSLGVPTTAGTGSEAQSFALISDAATHVKMACGDEKARFRGVILDPDLPRTAPRGVTAAAGMDALSHAVESFVSKAGNPVSRLWACEAFRRLERALPKLLTEDGSPDGCPDAWADALLGAHFAGAAIEQSMLGAAHALANPLTARHGIEHGAAVSLGLPHVVRFNGPAARDLYGELAAAAGLAGADPSEAIAARLEELRGLSGLPGSLAEAGVPAAAPLAELAGEAAEQWTAGFNPRTVTVEDLVRLYERAK